MSTPAQDQWRAPWRHLQLSRDSPEVEVSPGVIARIAMTRQALVAMVTMEPGTTQQTRADDGDSFVVVLTGDLRISSDIAPEPETVRADGLLILPAGKSHCLVAGPGGCTRMDVHAPPDMLLAQDAFHQEHSTHGFD